MGNPDRGGKGKGAKGMGPRGKHAFKVLCPDTLVTVLLGPRGSFKQQLEDDTGCKICASRRDEYYPGTQLRIVVIYGPSPEAILQVLEAIISRIVECGDQELKERPKARDTDFLGKGDGEYLIRGVIADKMATPLIGPRGSNVQAIRDETQAKVFVENTVIQGHQLFRVVGTAESLQGAVWRVLESCQMAADEPWFAEWSMVRYVTEASEMPVQHHQRDGDDRERSPRRGAADRQWDSGGGESSGWDEGWTAGQANSTGQSGAPHSAGTSAASNGSASAQAKPDSEPLAQAIDDAFKKIAPEGAQDFSISCDLPREKVSALIGHRGDHVKFVKDTTGADIAFSTEVHEGQQKLTLKGSLLSIYRAHTLLMKRYHDTEKPAEPAQEPENPELISDLEAQLQALQKQLAATTGGRSSSKKRSKGGSMR